MRRRKIIPISAKAKPACSFKDLPPSDPIRDMADVREARSRGYDLSSGMIDMDHLRAWLAERRAKLEKTPDLSELHK